MFLPPISDLGRRASVKVETKTVVFEGTPSVSPGPGEGLTNGAVVSVPKPKSRSGSIIGAISPIMGTGTLILNF